MTAAPQVRLLPVKTFQDICIFLNAFTRCSCRCCKLRTTLQRNDRESSTDPFPLSHPIFGFIADAGQRLPSKQPRHPHIGPGQHTNRHRQYTQKPQRCSPLSVRRTAQPNARGIDLRSNPQKRPRQPCRYTEAVSTNRQITPGWHISWNICCLSKPKPIQR